MSQQHNSIQGLESSSHRLNQISKQNSEKKRSAVKKKKVVLMHQLNSVNNSGSISGLASSKNSNRPSKTSKASNYDLDR